MHFMPAGWPIIAVLLAVLPLLGLALWLSKRWTAALDRNKSDASLEKHNAPPELTTSFHSSSSNFLASLGARSVGLFPPIAVFVLIAGVGAAATYVKGRFAAHDLEDANAIALPQTGADGEMYARLQEFTRSAGTKDKTRKSADKLLPDVDTMTEQLAARLMDAPDDGAGWRMLGWSYFYLARFDQAAAAYAKAVELEPGSDELRRSYEEAKAKAADAKISATTSSAPIDLFEKAGGTPGAGETTGVATLPPQAADDAVRMMVDGLAARLESAPRDVDGWIRLMRSRVVLGERDVAATAFRRALEIFSNDQPAMNTISATAADLGLTTE